MAMLKNRRRYFFALFAIGIFVFTSCSYRVKRSPDDLVYTLLADPAILNPVLTTEIAGFRVCDYIFDSLLTLDNKTFAPKPRLAKGWRLSADGLEATFFLRDDVTWHDGRKFTADDVVFTFEAIQDDRVNASLYRGLFQSLGKVEKLDDYTVSFSFEEPYFRMFTLVGGQIKIIPKHIFAGLNNFNTNPANRKPVGSGPYKFEKWDLGNRIDLTIYEKYYGEKPDIKGMTFKVIPDRTVAFQALKKGSLDVLKITPTEWKFQTDEKAFAEKFSKHMYYPPNMSFLAWNNKRPYFADSRVRKAMSMLIDRKKILDKIMFGLGTLTTGPLYRFGPNYDEGVEPYPYDPEAAKKLLDESGWVDHDEDGVRDKDGVPFRFSFMVRSGDRWAQSVGLFLQEELRGLGIEMEISTLEWATLVGKLMKRDYDAAPLKFSISVIEDPYNSWHSSSALNGSNYFGFVNKKADTLLEMARREYDSKKRGELYKEFHRIVHDEQPATFMYVMPDLMAISKRFENVIDYDVAPDTMEWKVGPSPTLWEW